MINYKNNIGWLADSIKARLEGLTARFLTVYNGNVEKIIGRFRSDNRFTVSDYWVSDYIDSGYIYVYFSGLFFCVDFFGSNSFRVY